MQPLPPLPAWTWMIASSTNFMNWVPRKEWIASGKHYLATSAILSFQRRPEVLYNSEAGHSVKCSGGARNTCFECFARIPHWIPAFAGMTVRINAPRQGKKCFHPKQKPRRSGAFTATSRRVKP
jgi:hypothetical protein